MIESRIPLSQITSISLPRDAAIEVLSNHTEAIAEFIVNKESWVFAMSDLEPDVHNAITSEASLFYHLAGLTDFECFVLIWNLRPNCINQETKLPKNQTTISHLLNIHSQRILLNEIDEWLIKIFAEMMSHCEPPEEPEWEFAQSKNFSDWFDTYLQELQT